MSAVAERVRGWLLSRPGRIESPGTVKWRLLLVATVMALSVSGVYSTGGSEAPAPFFGRELHDLAGLPEPPVRFAPTDDGDLRQLSPEEYGQLQEIRKLIERFPVPEMFVDQGQRPKAGRADGERSRQTRSADAERSRLSGARPGGRRG